jgi:multidrug efflux pump subunit AcrA (membrane-fusion protein)
MKKIILIVVIVGVAGYFGYTKFFAKTATIKYNTATAEKGTLIVSVSSSGSITSGNSVNITTTSTGTVSKVYVKNGDTVKQGQKIAELTLDQDSQQRQANAYASYLNAVSSSKSSTQSKQSTQASLESARKAVLDAQSAVDKMNNNLTNHVFNPATGADYTELEKQSILSTLTNARENFTATESKYNSSDYSISASSASVTSALLAYKQTSATITAPIGGVVSRFVLNPGISVSGTSSSSSSNSVSTQVLGAIIKPEGSIQAVVNLSEIDVTKVEPGQKVTITLGAFANKTFTGSVLMVNTNGSVSSGVTTYPATITIDTDATNIYPNMSVTANIITSTKDGAILVPAAAIQTKNGVSTARIMKNGQVTTVTVETGESNSSEVDVTSGISEGDVVVTGSSTSSTKSSTTTTNKSAFGSISGGGGMR